MEKLQAKFRGDRSRALHVARARKGEKFVCPFVASSKAVSECLVDAAVLKPGDVCLDLGCGDGSVLLEIAKRGVVDVRILGVDIDALLVATAKRRLGGYPFVTVDVADISDVDLRLASVIFTFLVPSCMAVLSDRFRADCAQSTRIICYKFPLPDWEHIESWEVEDVINPQTSARVYKYIVAARK